MKIIGILGYLVGLSMMALGLFQYLFRIKDGSLLVGEGFIVMLIAFSIRLVVSSTAKNSNKKEKNNDR